MYLIRNGSKAPGFPFGSRLYDSNFLVKELAAPIPRGINTPRTKPLKPGNRCGIPN
jgi:hypothetical protein